MLKRVGGDPAQDRWAARTTGRSARIEFRMCCNSPHPGHSRSCGFVAGASTRKAEAVIHARTGSVVNIAATPSASRPTATLIAATSPGTPGAEGGTGKAETAQQRLALTGKLDRHLGLQDQIAGSVLVEALDVDARAWRRGVRLPRHCRRSPCSAADAGPSSSTKTRFSIAAKRLAPPIVRHDVEPVVLRRADDLRAFEKMRNRDLLDQHHLWAARLYGTRCGRDRIRAPDRAMNRR